MDYSMFSTSPGATANYGGSSTNSNNGGNSVHNAGGSNAVHSATMSNHSGVGGNTNPNVNLFGTGDPSMTPYHGMARQGGAGLMGQRPIGSTNPSGGNHHTIFSTTPQPSGQLGAFGNLYMGTNYNLELSPSNPSGNPNAATANSLFDPQSLAPFSQTLSFLQDINDDKHMVNWKELMDVEHPEESARKLQEAVVKSNTDRASAATSIAAVVRHPADLSVVAQLEEELQKLVRNAVLQDLLDQLTNPTTYPYATAAEMLAEMSRLGLVRLPGVVAVVDQLLADADKRRAGLSVLGRVAEQNKGSEAFLKAFQEKPNIQQTILSLYKDPEFECDVVTITRLLAGEQALQTAVALRPSVKIPYSAPTTAQHYVQRRDELVTVRADGTLAYYGAPTATGEVLPKGTLDLVGNFTPTGVSGPRGGQYLAVSGLPTTEAAAPYVEARKKVEGSKTTNTVPVVQLLAPNESGWSLGGVVSRPTGVVPTAITALSSNTVCLAESNNTHDLTMIDPVQVTATSTIPSAHGDHITVLAPSESEFAFVSGSRDKIVKLWDSRKPAAVATLSSPAHTDTISSLESFKSYILTSSLDGTMLVWDARKLEKPVANRTFSNPVLSICTLEERRIAVSTARCLHLLSLESLGSIDATPNVCYTSLCATPSGNAVFALCEGGCRY